MKVKEVKSMMNLEEKPQEPRKPKLGECVYYYKNIQTNNGVTIEKYAAIVTSFPTGISNFQEKDMAVDLHIFPVKAGAGIEHKFGVMFASERTPGRWSFRD